MILVPRLMQALGQSAGERVEKALPRATD